MITTLAGCTTGFQSSTGDTNSDSETTRDVNGGTPAGTSLLNVSTDITKFGINLQNNPVIGSPDAPIDLYYWSDYQCPFCQKFQQNTFPKLIKTYVQPGRLRIVILEKPYLGKASETAARMAKCVWRTVREENPDAFKHWHATMFDKQGKENSGWAKKKNLREITRQVAGVDVNAVDSCMANHTKEVKASIDADVQVAEKNGIRGTPAFIFFDRKSEKAGKLVGAQPYSLFKKAIRKVNTA